MLFDIHQINWFDECRTVPSGFVMNDSTIKLFRVLVSLLLVLTDVGLALDVLNADADATDRASVRRRHARRSDRTY